MDDALTVESVIQGRFLRPIYVCACDGVAWSSFGFARDLISVTTEYILFFLPFRVSRQQHIHSSREL